MSGSYPDRNNGPGRDATSIPKEFRVVCSDCGADGGTYSFTVLQGEPSYCPWCGHTVDGDVTSVVSAETETTALSHRGGQ
jgi:hypothetical protein